MNLTLLLALIVLAHLWGDLIIQTDHQAARKPHCWRAMAGHLAGYHVPMGAVALAGWGWSWQTLAFLAISAVTHGLIDRRWPVTRLHCATGSPRFAATTLGAFTVDQTLHLTVLVLTLTALR